MGECTVDGCERDAATRAMCQAHYQRWRRENADPCSVDGCDRGAGTRGLCDLHYRRWRTHGDTGTVAKSGRKKQPVRACSIDGCDQPHKSRGWCGTHYARWLRDGDPGPLSIEVGGGLIERVLSRLDVGHPLGCWEWTSTLSPSGYGRVRSVTEGWLPVHRIVYEHVHDPIPEDLTLDHLCRNRRCANPDHIEPVAMRTNVLRGYGPSAANARKVRCLRDHPLWGDNLYVDPSGRRRCRTCMARHMRRYREQRRKAA